MAVFPLSLEPVRYEPLLRSVGAYRLVLRQPRHSELVRYAGSGRDLSWAQMDLAPRPQCGRGQHLILGVGQDEILAGRAKLQGLPVDVLQNCQPFPGRRRKPSRDERMSRTGVPPELGDLAYRV